MSTEIKMQQILGTDKRNPSFTICRGMDTGYLHIYFGGEILEKVSEDKNDPQYKMLVARLYNAGVNAVKLKEAFGADHKTMKSWGDALTSGDPERLVRVLAGRQARRKLTPEIRAFVRMRFRILYRAHPYSYNKQIRAEIADVYGENLCPETLRPLLKELKQQIKDASGGKDEKRETSGECIVEADACHEEQSEQFQQEIAQKCVTESFDIRQRSPISVEAPKTAVIFIHHLGVLLFSTVLLQVESLIAEMGWLAKQWLAALFIGAVNVEQSKLLDFDGLDVLLGRTLRCCRPQRQQLSALACTDAADQLLMLNARNVDVQSYTDFYYDPHTKQARTKMKILKGWCGSKHFADKALHMDFIHTSAGHPVYIGYEDNYNDLRERFGRTVKDFRHKLGIDTERVLSFVLDRGIFGGEIFHDIVEDKHLHIVTWEKGYKPGSWDEKRVKGMFVMDRCRNRAEDIRKYSFEYMDQDWEKYPDMRLLRVRATNPQKRTIEIGILSDDQERPAEDLIRLMFSRWVQENDFKYLEKHFGINQTTSYATISYKDLKDQVEDKQMKSGEYKALQKERQILQENLKRLLLQEHQHPEKSFKRKEKIKELTLQDETLTHAMKETQKQVSRLEYLMDECYQRLDVTNKRVMDALKLIARNSFYQSLQPFKAKYNNYRDDHAIFRNLTRAHGLMISRENQVEAQIFPTAYYPPALRTIVKNLFAQINADNPLMPDGSRRQLIFTLGEKSGIKLANENQLLP